MKLSEVRRITEEMSSIAQADRENAMQTLLQNMGIDPENLYQELEMESKYVDTHQDSSFSNHLLRLHSHSFYEILFCRNTCGAEYLVGSNRYRLQNGDIIMIPPGMSHRPLLPDPAPEPYIRDVLWVSSDFVRMLKDMFPSEDFHEIRDTHLLRTAGTQWEFLGQKFRQGILESEAKNFGWEVAVVANTIQLIVQLRRAVQNRTVKEMRAEKPELLDQVMAYIEKNLAGKISLADVSKQFYVSESTISQMFRKKMGVSFYRCVTQRRLIAAKNLILQDILLEEIAQQTGFSDYSTFYRAFKGEFGISPRQYRLQYANTEKEKHP